MSKSSWFVFLSDLCTVAFFEILYARFINPFLLARFAAKEPSNLLIVGGAYVVFLVSAVYLMKLEPFQSPAKPVSRDRKEEENKWSLPFLFGSVIWPCFIVVLTIYITDFKSHPDSAVVRFDNAVNVFLSELPAWGSKILTGVMSILLVALTGAFIISLPMIGSGFCEVTIPLGTKKHAGIAFLSMMGINFMSVINALMLKTAVSAEFSDPFMTFREHIFVAVATFFIILPFVYMPPRLLLFLKNPPRLDVISTVLSMAYFSWKITGL